jgi:hypothetical protein
MNMLNRIFLALALIVSAGCFGRYGTLDLTVGSPAVC